MYLVQIIEDLSTGHYKPHVEHLSSFSFQVKTPEYSVMDCIPVKGKAFEVHYGYDDGNLKPPGEIRSHDGELLEDIAGLYLLGEACGAVGILRIINLFEKWGNIDKYEFIDCKRILFNKLKPYVLYSKI